MGCRMSVRALNPAVPGARKSHVLALRLANRPTEEESASVRARRYRLPLHNPYL